MFEKLLEMVITQMPVVVVLFYILKGREDRIDELENRIDECLDSTKDNNKAINDLIRK